ncbi:PP2C family protein-serine/threonine phosphatase [Planosporangium sp. 12N6]|uniref:PP2C family protein-serine/threonine phosphatase n=1 Tax=Planosporangium spinosum TaxID=3402278 RepID=UPI003CF69AC2
MSGCSASARELWQILTDDGIPAQLRTPHSLLVDRWPVGSTPDTLLVNAAIDTATIRDLVARIVADIGRPPAVVSFAAHDCAELATHVADGRDYLIGPFRPHLVRGRLATSRHHRDLNLALSEMRATADRRGLERELRIGREIQRGFLPETLPSIAGWDIAACFQPAREVSGDFYDAYDVINGDFLGFAIADVCDKGIGAALFMALIRSLLRQAAMADRTVREEPHPDAPGPAAWPLATSGLALHAVRTTNDYLTANHLHQAYFATLFFGVVDPRTGDLVYINCGHNPPILRRARGDQYPLLPTGPALGLMDDAHFELGRATLHPGDLLFLYTDGVPEAKGPDGRFFGEERMRRMLAEPGTAAAVVERFADAVRTHSGTAEQFDDVTMLGLHRQTAAEHLDPSARTPTGALTGGT